MHRCIVGALALGSFILTFIFPAASDMANPSDNRSLPMRFQVWHEASSERCGDNCRVWISAAGTITADTPHVFEKFAHSHNIRGGTLVLDSDGGEVLPSIALGHAIRQLDLTTSVGRTVEDSGDDDDHGDDADHLGGKISPEASCGSMCVFVLIAGNRRFVPAEAQVLVHDIWLDDCRTDAMTRSYSAQDIAIVERDIGRLARYTSEMGGFGELLETAMRIAPWEPPRVLTNDELRRMGLNTISTLFERPAKVAALSYSARWQGRATRPISSASTHSRHQIPYDTGSHRLQQAQWQPDQHAEPDQR
jgi:hypothetical protein